MISLMRTIIDLTPTQVEALAKLADEQNLSRSALIRKAVDAYVEAHSTSEIARAFGLWKMRKVDGLTYQQALRDEWE
jgi:metal-responsive CopG/Arc/MetJ family transcriptional regulator